MYQLLITIGFLPDGQLSKNEKSQIAALQQEGLLDIGAAVIRKYQHDFFKWQGN